MKPYWKLLKIFWAKWVVLTWSLTATFFQVNLIMHVCICNEISEFIKFLMHPYRIHDITLIYSWH
jgi:hypothetical protein